MAVHKRMIRIRNMTRIRLLIDSSNDQIRLLIAETHALKRPVPSKLLALWLHLPIVMSTPTGPVKHRSSFEAALQHCPIVAHRDHNGEVRDGRTSADWLGAAGYLMRIELIGSLVRLKK